MPQVQLANRSALFLSTGFGGLIEHARAGDFCFEHETRSSEHPSGTYLVLYLLVPGAGREPELVKLYMERTSTRWDTPGDIVAWDWNHRAPTLFGWIQTEHWTGKFEHGNLWTEVGECSGRKVLRHA